MPRQNIIGWLPEISVTLHNLKAEHSLQYANLVSVVNEHTATGTPITITPRYDETDDYGLAYDCVIDSDFDPQDIANCNAGQTIDLVFYGTETYMSIPNVFSGLEIYDVVDYNGDSGVVGSATNNNDPIEEEMGKRLIAVHQKQVHSFCGLSQFHITAQPGALNDICRNQDAVFGVKTVEEQAQAILPTFPRANVHKQTIDSAGINSATAVTGSTAQRLHIDGAATHPRADRLSV